MEPPPRVGLSNLAVPTGAVNTINKFPQVDPPFSKEHLYSRLNTIFASHYTNRFPFDTPVPAFKIDAIVSKILKIGPYQMNGYGISISTAQYMMQFEASSNLTLIKPEKELLPFPKEALEHILTLLKLSRSGIEVIDVKDKQFLSWGLLSQSDETNWTVECYSLEFSKEGKAYHFYFDKKLRFFKNALTDEIHFREPLLSPSASLECLIEASRKLGLLLVELKITKVVPIINNNDTGYHVEINKGLLNLFYQCYPND